MSKNSDDEQDVAQKASDIRSPKATRRQTLANLNEAALSKEQYPGWRLKLHKTLRSWSFETTVGILVVINVALCWYETDAGAFPNNPDDIPGWIEYANLTMLGLYAFEVSLRLICDQGRFFVGIVNWDTFDLLLVFSDLLLLCIDKLSSMDRNGVVRALRIGRSLRIVKAIRVWPAFRELYVMMHGLLGAFRAMLWSAVLLSLILILFGIVAVEMINPLVRQIDAEGGFGDCPRCSRAFATVWDSMVTFFQQVVAGDSWGLITIPVMESFPFTAPFFVVVVVTIQFGILNLILVAIVDQAHKSSTEDATFQARSRKEEFENSRKIVLNLCAEIDSDKSGEISLQELMHGYATMPELANQLRFLDVKKDDMRILFSTLDTDGSGNVSYEEFVEQLFNMQNQDTGVLLSFIRSYVQDIRKQITLQNEQIESLRQSNDELRNIVLETRELTHELASDRVHKSIDKRPPTPMGLRSNCMPPPSSSQRELDVLIAHHLETLNSLKRLRFNTICNQGDLDAGTTRSGSEQVGELVGDSQDAEDPEMLPASAWVCPPELDGLKDGKLSAKKLASELKKVNAADQGLTAALSCEGSRVNVNGEQVRETPRSSADISSV
eukprot:gb/GFBE01054018.1/.p1 GENE.gb/GFBE01054018.1/~~gb/GFBE01054018.1/.p1  ORF type:complete len:610 (+),score=131.11 gb/GFBE01054018.1/:1-1830(+)